MVKGCDARAVVVLVRESQIERSAVVLIGMVCDGMGQPRAPKCASCGVHLPAEVDILLRPSGDASSPCNPVAPAGQADAGEAQNETGNGRYAALDRLLALAPSERLAYWKEELARCTRCYACRQVCPMCYCRQCLVEKNRPQCIDTSPTLKGNFAWHITRAFHLAGRCIGCDQCSQVCPAGIDLGLLNLSLARAAERHFGFLAGEDPAAEPLVGSYADDDREGFIR